MARKSLAALPLLLLFCSATAAAQDYGTRWLDRISHQVLETEGPLDTLPLTFQFSAGEFYAYDSNIFLTHDDRTSDSVLVTFGQVILKYAEVNWDAEVDFTANYNAYLDTDDASTDEERLFGRIRMIGSHVSLQLSEIARRESSPTDVVFTNRARRFISDTTPELIVRLTDDFSMELTSTLEYVHYQDENFQIADNLNTRSMAGIVYSMKRSVLDFLVQVGYLTIGYTDNNAPTDVVGWIGRMGVRGDVNPDLRIVALAGVTHAESDHDPVTGEDDHRTTMDAEVRLSYTVSESVTAYADYTRRFGFASGASFQVVDSSSLLVEYAPREDLKLRGRLQYDRSHDVDGRRRAYYSATAGPEFRVLENLILEAHATYRIGSAPGANDAGDFTDLILAAGAALIF